MSVSVSEKVLINDFRRDPEELITSQVAAVERVLRSGQYVLGPEVVDFEKKWADYSGVPFSVGVGNGLDAIEIGLRAIGVGVGDEVITTGMTAIASVLGITRAGATPVLADIDPRTALLDPESSARCITSRTRAIMPVHLYGQVRGMDGWRRFCSDHGIFLVEDCAQAHGAVESDTPAGAFGEWGACSFYPTKNLGAVGDGGALNTTCESTALTARKLRNYGQSERYHHPLLGLNSRLDELQAALLSERLKFLPQFTERRKGIASAYYSGISTEKVKLLDPPLEPSAHVHHLFVVLAIDRYKLGAHLATRGIQTLIHYPIPVHYQQPYAKIIRDPEGLTATERHATECLSIPCHPNMTDEDVDHVINSINDFE